MSEHREHPTGAAKQQEAAPGERRESAAAGRSEWVSPDPRAPRWLSARPGFSTRVMRDNDLAEVLAIERASFGVPWSLRMFLSELHHALSWCRVLIDDEERVAGYLVCRFHGDLWHVMDVAIREDLRGRGLGATLLDEFLELSAGSQADYTLEVRPSNAVALALYRSRGFEIVGRRPGYYHDNREDALIMVRTGDRP